MVERLAFLLIVLAEGALAATFGAWLHRRLGLSRIDASMRACAAAVIGTGASHPLLWLGFSRLLEWTGIWGDAAALGVTGVILFETLFYAAALRGHWRWSLALSTLINLISFGLGMALTTVLPRPA